MVPAIMTIFAFELLTRVGPVKDLTGPTVYFEIISKGPSNRSLISHIGVASGLSILV